MCVVTPATVPGLCAETPTLNLVGSLNATEIIREREQRKIFDFVEDTFVARF